MMNKFYDVLGSVILTKKWREFQHLLKTHFGEVDLSVKHLATQRQLSYRFVWYLATTNWLKLTKVNAPE